MAQVFALRDRWLLALIFPLALVAGSRLAIAQDEAKPAEATPDKIAAPPKAVAPANVGRLIRVPLPIAESDNTDAQVKRSIERALSEFPKDANRPVLVLEFSPAKGKFGEGTDFGRALALARYLSSRELAGAKTVAYVPKTIKGHGVLPVMACEEIVMAPDAELGEAGLDERAGEGVDPTVLAGYKQIADRRRTVPPQVALGMIDKDAEVLKVETDVSPEYILRSELEALKHRRTVQSETVLKQPGELGRFSGRQGRELGFVKFLADDRGALAKALDLPATAIEDDPSAGGEWNPLMVRIRGPVSGAQVSLVQRKIEDAVRDDNANFICILIDSPGGSPDDSMNLANMLADLDSAKVRTVAYIQKEARGDAALIALGCDQIVMNANATIGGPGAADLQDKEQVQLIADSIRNHLAPKKSRSWSVPAALVDSERKVYRYQNQGDGRSAFYSPEEVETFPDAKEWQQGDALTKGRGPLKLLGTQAQDVGLARHLAGDFHAFKQIYGLEQDPKLIEPGWADYLIDRLASPGVGWLLLLVGLAALYAEVQAPGIGVGGFVAGVCFLLFFWNRFFEGTAGWLEVFLFLGGLSCILIELFVLPGTAIFGLGGGLMILSSLILASQTFVLPHNDYQWDQLQNSLVSLLAVFGGLIVSAIVMRRFLPRTPWVSSMLLEPPSGEELESLSERETVVDFRHFVGKTGVAATQMLPSGKARIDGHLIDVTAEGEIIERGQAIVVTKVQGNRVVVKSHTDAGEA